LDASRSVTVVSSLLGENKSAFVEDIIEEYEEMREDYYAGLEDRYYLTYDQANGQKFNIDFEKYPPAPTPRKLGLTVIDQVKIADIVPYIDWVSESSCFLLGIVHIFVDTV
jgi:5-methyltetrahydrofolate--homocysteine methyltransferase